MEVTAIKNNIEKILDDNKAQKYYFYKFKK